MIYLIQALFPLLAFVSLPLVYATAYTWRNPGVAQVFWPQTWRSALAFALAFNLTFFIQEVFLVWPKAVTATLEPTLFHNNHIWRGTHPHLDLLQGTGALGTIAAGAVAWYWLARHTPRTLEWRLFVFWMAVLGFLSALPQVVIGAIIHANDVGRAMTGLGFSQWARWVAACAAMLIMAVLCWQLAPYLLRMVRLNGSVGEGAHAAFWLAFLPCVLAVPLIVPFRMPNDPVEILLPPVLDALIAGSWLWFAGTRVRGADHAEVSPGSALTLAVALIALLAFFHLVLAPGVSF